MATTYCHVVTACVCMSIVQQFNQLIVWQKDSRIISKQEQLKMYTPNRLAKQTEICTNRKSELAQKHVHATLPIYPYFYDLDDRNSYILLRLVIVMFILCWHVLSVQFTTFQISGYMRIIFTVTCSTCMINLALRADGYDKLRWIVNYCKN